MTQFILLFTFFLSPFFARPVFGASPLIKRENVVLLSLQEKFTKFLVTVEETDEKLREMRKAVAEKRNRDVSNLVDEITKLTSLARRRFKDIERFYTDAQKQRLNLHRTGREQRVSLTPDVITYLAIRKNDRFGMGAPMDMSLAAWRGLRIGSKHQKLPSTLRRRGEIAGLPLKQTDGILAITLNGGIIRGVYEGTIGGSYVIRETLPYSMRRQQLHDGVYRTFNLDDVARVEIARRPPTLSPQTQPPPMISDDGDYSVYYVRKDYLWRVSLRPSEVELLDLVKEGRFADAQFQPTVTSIDPTIDHRPDYAPQFFYDCENEL